MKTRRDLLRAALGAVAALPLYGLAGAVPSAPVRFQRPTQSVGSTDLLATQHPDGFLEHWAVNVAQSYRGMGKSRLAASLANSRAAFPVRGRTSR